MITKKEIISIKKLDNKKERYEKGLFIAEGPLLVADLIKRGAKHYKIFTTTKYDFLKNLSSIEYICEKDLLRISSMKTPNNILGLFYIKTQPTIENFIKSDKILILNDIQDPGNMGNILRTAEWLDFKYIVSTLNSVDIYNPKVVQASMGSIMGINIAYLDLEQIKYISRTHCLIATDIIGESICNFKIDFPYAIIIGNEGSGISKELMNMANIILNIPRKNKLNLPESLNAATAAAIIMWHFTMCIL
ncbi:MAG: TrmH family RNA methyltransferase [Bacteroidales bacterium]|nr:TrmH family RNA methyltransferase [Bacteroidales bacterium]MDI9575903.1 TrmH family RNA methyltransferase [Bacteroidota bacterium]MDY0400976.1 TrmH family RNA methyltransferase [Bacteroidales bacterium]HHW59724.1 RNA methyltransferase [Bacteroidales bacterium]HOB78387.1 TrmH family RNA methyltransferase [Bacteroidales bacterium]